MNWFKKALTVLGPRILGAAASLVTGYIFAKTKGAITLDPTQVVEIAGSMLATYAVAHRATSAVVNPGDSAAPVLVPVDKQIVTEVKALPEGVVPTISVVGSGFAK